MKWTIRKYAEYFRIHNIKDSVSDMIGLIKINSYRFNSRFNPTHIISSYLLHISIDFISSINYKIHNYLSTSDVMANFVFSVTRWFPVVALPWQWIYLKDKYFWLTERSQKRPWTCLVSTLQVNDRIYAPREAPVSYQHLVLASA